MENLYNSKKFWILWFSCLGSPKTVKEVHEAWDYSEGSKALYQPAGTGHEKSIAQEMIDEGYLSVEREIQRRGAKAKKLYSNTEWYTELIKEELDSKVKEKYQNSVNSSFVEFKKAMNDTDFRFTAFRLSSVKKAFSGRRALDKDKMLLPFYIYLVLLSLRVSKDYVESEMSFSFEKVFGAGLIDEEELASDVIRQNFSLSDYLSEQYSLHGISDIRCSKLDHLSSDESSLDKCMPETSLQSELYSQLYQEFGGRISEISDLLG